MHYVLDKINGYANMPIRNNMGEQSVKTLRSIATHARYEQHCASPLFSKNCYLCSAPPIKAYRHWKVIENQYPYDEIATMHDMVVLLRHDSEENLTRAEVREYKKVKADLHGSYDMILENTRAQKSIPGHHHLHVLRIKERVMGKIKERPRAVFFTPATHTANESPP